MIEVDLYHDAHRAMEADKSLDGFYPVNSAVLRKKMNEEEFDDFCKANNLILYRNKLKRYEDGMTCGEFTLT